MRYFESELENLKANSGKAENLLKSLYELWVELRELKHYAKTGPSSLEFKIDIALNDCMNSQKLATS
jgi:hypothetical protein